MCCCALGPLIGKCSLLGLLHACAPALPCPHCRSRSPNPAQVQRLLAAAALALRGCCGPVDHPLLPCLPPGSAQGLHHLDSAQNPFLRGPGRCLALGNSSSHFRSTQPYVCPRACQPGQVWGAEGICCYPPCSLLPSLLPHPASSHGRAQHQQQQAATATAAAGAASFACHSCICAVRAPF